MAGLSLSRSLSLSLTHTHTPTSPETAAADDWSDFTWGCIPRSTEARASSGDTTPCKVRTSQSKSGTSVDLSNSGNVQAKVRYSEQRQGAWAMEEASLRHSLRAMLHEVLLLLLLYYSQASS